MISEDRLNHMIAVARKMKYWATQYNELGIHPDEAFTLGLLHDIGYEFTNKNEYHTLEGGEILRKQNYKYWKEILYHGMPQISYDSVALQLLNYADMTTGPDGKYLTMEERLDDIGVRYGKESPQYQVAVDMINIIDNYELVQRITSK